MLSLIEITPTMDESTRANAINENFRQIAGESRTQIIKDEDGQQRMIIGKAPNGEYLIAISAKGVDVIQALGT